MYQPSKYILRQRAQDRCITYIATAALTPVVVLTITCLAIMLGSPPSSSAFHSLVPVLVWSTLSMFALFGAFHLYVWFRS